MAAAPEPPATFAALLRQLRVGAGLTQEALAAAASLSSRAVSDLERGINRTARRDTARLLADALSLTGPARARFEEAARGDQAVTAGPIGTMATATRTLPRASAAFTGRDTELRQLLGSASTTGTGGEVNIHAVGGMAGIGKTTLAVHAAHLLAPSFPDGQIFLSLHAHTPGRRPVDPSDALASLLLTAGIAATQIPPELDARSRLWRDHLAGKRLLLLLDDAAGHEQIRPLLPGTAGILVLVTSRRRLIALEDAQAVSLDTLSPDEAADLVVRLAGRPGLTAPDTAVREIGRLCGYLPLAVGMLARQLHNHPAWTAGQLAADLATARDRLQLMRAENVSVAAALDMSYSDLTPARQRLFRRLGQHPGTDIDAYSAAALDQTSLGAARQNLDALYDHYLIGEPARGRFRLHDLAREHSQALGADEPAGDREAPVDRLLAYYLHTTRLANRHFSRRPVPDGAAFEAPVPEHFPDLTARQDALDWLDRERGNIQAAADVAARRSRPAMAVALAAALHAYLRFAGHFDQARWLHYTAIDLAVQAGDRNAEAEARANLGDLQLAVREYHEAAASLTDALELYRALGDRTGEANVLTDMAAVSYLTGQFPAAVASLTRGLELYRELGQRLGEANVLGRLGNIQLATDDYVAAAASLTEALKLYRGLNDSLGEAYALTELGALQVATADHELAASHLQQALDLYRQLGDRVSEAYALLDLAALQEATQDYEAAGEGLKYALELYDDLGDRLGKANALNQFGPVQHATGSTEAAAVSLQQALELYRELGDRAGEAEALIHMGDIAAGSANSAHARDCYEHARVVAADIAAPSLEARALEGIGQCHRRDGDTGQATAALLAALEIYQRIGSPDATKVESAIHALDS